MKATVTALLLISAAPFAQPSPLLHGDGTDQLTAADIHDIEDLASEILPRHRLAVIDAMVRAEGEHAGEISLLHVFAEPDEQSFRLWHGMFFKCVPEFAYHPPILPETASQQTRYLNLTIHKRGRWIAQFADPTEHYAVVSPPGQMLPAFSSNFLYHYFPFRFGSATDSKEAIAAYDFVMTAGPRYLDNQHPVDLRSEPIHFLQVSSGGATVHLGHYKFELKRPSSQWEIANVKTYRSAFGGIVRPKGDAGQESETTSIKSEDADVTHKR